MADSQNAGGRLGLKGPGDKGRQLMMGVALGAIILAALGITVWQFMGGDGDVPAKVDARVRLACMECGKEFERQLPIYAGEEGGAMPVDCELCGKTRCALAMLKCPECREYYLSEAMKVRARYAIAVMKGGENVAPPKVPDNVCPHCNCNIREYWRNRARDLSGAKGRE